MLQILEQVEYRWGLLEDGKSPGELPVKSWRGAKIPKKFRKALLEEDLLNLGGSYGEKDVGDPPEYDHLRLILTDDVVEIEVFNRGLSLAGGSDKKILRIHRGIGALGRSGG